MALYLNKLESAVPKNAVCQIWLKLALWFLRIDGNVKSSQTDEQKDGGQHAFRKAQLSKKHINETFFFK